MIGRIISIPRCRLAVPAALLVVSALSVGCAQDPQSIFSRVWGPAGSTIRSATDGMLAIVGANSRASDSGRELATRQDSSNVPARVHFSGQQEGVQTASVRPTSDDFPPRGNVFSAFVQKAALDREPADDPFLDTPVVASSVGDTESFAAEANRKAYDQRDWIRNPEEPPTPSALRKTEPSRKDAPAAMDRSFRAPGRYASLPSQSSRPTRSSASNVSRRDQFESDIDSQMQRLQAAMDEDMHRHEAESPQPEWAAIAEARSRIDAQMQKAQRLADRGRLAEGYYAARQAADQADRAGLSYGTGEVSPAALVKSLEDRLNIIGTATVKSQPQQTAAERRDAHRAGANAGAEAGEPNTGAVSDEHEQFASADAEEAGSNRPVITPRETIAATSNHAESRNGPKPDDPSDDVEMLPPPPHSADEFDGMIVDSDTLEPRISSRALGTAQVDLPEQSTASNPHTDHDWQHLDQSGERRKQPKSDDEEVYIPQSFDTVRANANQGSVVTAGHQRVTLHRIAEPPAAAVPHTSAAAPAEDFATNEPADDGGVLNAPPPPDELGYVASDGDTLEESKNAFAPIAIEDQPPMEPGSDTVSIHVPLPVAIGLVAIVVYLIGLTLWRRRRLETKPTGT